MSRYKDTDYLNISMRIKYLEARLMGSEAFSRVLSCKTPEEAVALICERLGFDCPVCPTPYEFESVIASEEKKVSEFLRKNVPDTSLIDIFDIRRDFMNIRALIKADIRNISPDPMLVFGGTLTKDGIKKAFRERDEKVLNGYFMSAVKTSQQAFAQTADPQKIDTVCDRICFECLKNAADSSPFDFVSGFFGTRIDIINIISLIRQSLMGKDSGFFSETVLPGGRLFTEKQLVPFTSSPLGEFTEFISHTEYADVTKGFDVSSPDPSVLEKNADKFVCKLVKQLRKTPFGPQVVAGYILAKEYEIKNIRIAMSGILSGQDSEAIKERLRLGYE
ncbi:MAG: V-type ATPase subunit [Clostridia bacterium]|nr:V-type ATPase subunit [Clostridia bacterium]